MRNVEDNPPNKALTLSEWLGMKVWQIATIPPIHPSQATSESEEPRKWRYSQSGINYLTEGTTREADRSRTTLREDKGKGDPKGKGSGKKGKKPAKVIGTPEGEETERVGKRYFPGPATLPEAWRDKKPEELVSCQVLLKRIQEGQLWRLSKVRMESRSLEDHGWSLMLQLGETGSLKIKLEIPSYGTLHRH